MLLLAQVEFKVLPDIRTARVGDIITLHIEAKIPSGTPIKWSIPDSIPHWEWMDKGLPVPVSTGSVVSFSFNCRFVGYDTGYWHIPPIKLIAGNHTFVADTSFIQVNYANSDLSQPFRDTKPLMELPEATPSWFRWFIGLGLILLLSFGLYLFYERKRRGNKLKVTTGLSLAYFLQQVHILEKEYQSGNLRERQFYERWIEILRKYIRWQTGTMSTDQGTRQIVESMKRAGIQEELRETLGVCLQISERARFACHRPDDASNKNALKVSKAALETNHLNS
jgi:hypothetical protein